MAERGSWVTPVLEGRAWLEKPPLYYWATIPIYAVLGARETTARAAPALFALLTAIVTLWFGRRFFGPAAGLYGGAILLSSFGFAAYGRSASTDMPMTACLTAALALAGAAAVGPGIPTGWVLAGWAFLGLAVLGKGPVALLVATGIGALFWWLDDAGGALRRWRLLPGLIVLAAVALPWFWLVYRQNGFAFLAVFFVNHHLARYVSDLHHHAEPVWYYVPVLLGILFPWSGWLPLVAVRRGWHGARLWLLCWALFPLIFFSLSTS